MSLPAAPTNVTVAPGTAQATVRWTASTSSDVTGYKIFCNPDNKLPNLAAADATSLVVTKLKNGLPCSFRVHAINATGMSASSIPAVPALPPAAPKVLAVRGSAPGSLLVTVSGKPQKGSSLIHYNFSVSPEAPSATIPTNVAAAANFGASATITGLTVGQSYVVSATLTSPTGTSVPGIAKPVSAADIPGAPVITGATASVNSAAASVQITWTTPLLNGLPILGYVVSYRIGEGTPIVVTTKAVNLLMIKGLIRGTTYSFSVKAKNLQGDSEVSNIMTATPT
jgi:hypothetical protein